MSALVWWLILFTGQKWSVNVCPPYQVCATVSVSEDNSASVCPLWLVGSAPLQERSVC